MSVSDLGNACALRSTLCHQSLSSTCRAQGALERFLFHYCYCLFLCFIRWNNLSDSDGLNKLMVGLVDNDNYNTRYLLQAQHVKFELRYTDRSTLRVLECDGPCAGTGVWAVGW